MGREVVVLIVISLLCLGSIAPSGGSDEGRSDRGIELYDEDYPVWTDSLDDLSHVYQTLGVEVSGGDAHLASGETKGWIASSIINPPEGYHYDLVVLEVETPGNSYVELSVLDASEEPSEVGFANETIDGAKLMRVSSDEAIVSVYHVDWQVYPEVRIQLNLVSNGSASPRLFAWSLYFIGLDEWRDDFLGKSKMSDFRGLNITAECVEVDLTGDFATGPMGGYDTFPTMAVPYADNIGLLYANSDRTGYEDVELIPVGTPRSLQFGDFSGDGILDLMAQSGYSSIIIFSGDASGKFSRVDNASFDVSYHINRAVPGDFNGDGWCDVLTIDVNPDTVHIHFNEGGYIDNETDVTLNIVSPSILTADFDNDSCDDIFQITASSCDIYYSSESGPDETVDVRLMGDPSGCAFKDVNLDGHLDVVLGKETPFKGIEVYYGSSDGIDNVTDVSIEIPYFRFSSVEAGDVNGDGFVDILGVDRISPPYDYGIFIYPGAEDGWNSSRYVQDIMVNYSYWNELQVKDLNKDGYADIIHPFRPDGSSYYEMWIFMGGPSWPTEPTIVKDFHASNDMVIAIPRRVGDISRLYGAFTTQTIQIPPGQKWDMVHLESTVPENVTIELTVINATTDAPIDGYTEVNATDLDLSGIDPDLHRVIKLKVDILTPVNVTPVLNSLMVNWMDDMTWREQFYGMTKIEECTGLAPKDGELQRAQEMGGPDSGSYLSKAFGPDVPGTAGTFHTFRYTARFGSSQSGMLRLVDVATSEVLAETPLSSGDQEWDLVNAFRLREHPSIRVNVTAEGLDLPGEFALDDLWLNWTKRVLMHPEVQGISLSEPSVYRLQTVRLSVNVTDEYDPADELTVTVHHRLNGTEDWYWGLFGTKTFKDGLWSMDLSPRVDTTAGLYDLRVLVRDSDNLDSGWVEFPNMLEVLNNIPTAPEIGLFPALPDTTSTLRVEILRGAQDAEGSGLTYSYRWFLDGVLQPLQVTDSVDPSLTHKGQNWSVEVWASDGEDEGPVVTAWRLIGNSAPRTAQDLPDPAFDEDTMDSEWLDLSTAFEDADGDALTWSIETPPVHITVEVDPVTGKVTLAPEENWNGQDNITFVASDGEDTAWQTVTVYVNPVNDLPWFSTVNGEPVGEGPVEMTIRQGEVLSIDILVLDIEGDELVFDVNTTLFEVDGSTGTIRWQPENDQVGTLRFRLTVWDVVTPSAKVSLDFIVTVENENDPMDDPRITAPSDGARFEEGILFSLIATCTDPDTRYGQVLNFSWSSNMSGHLGYGPSLSINLTDVGTHVITLTVTDGEFQRTAMVTVVIKAKAEVTPPPDGDGGTEEPFNYALVAGIVVAIGVIGVLFFVARTRKRTEELETADEEEYKREHMERAYEAVKTAADKMEAEREAVPEVEEEIEVVTDTAPSTGLTIEARETEAASAQTMALFGAVAAEPVLSEEEAEQLRLDNLKRKYQNAIGRLPYGIPSPELREWDWVDLASALATGDKQTLPDGAEVTEIDGRWYHSDADDTGTFLKEHGARKEEPRKAEAAPADKTALLAKLEERFILGEISEEAYMRLVEKYSGED